MTSVTTERSFASYTDLPGEPNDAAAPTQLVLAVHYVCIIQRTPLIFRPWSRHLCHPIILGSFGTSELLCMQISLVPHKFSVLRLPQTPTAYSPFRKSLLCVVMPLHEWATGSLPPAGCPPTRQVGPSEVHVSV